MPPDSGNHGCRGSSAWPTATLLFTGRPRERKRSTCRHGRGELFVVLPGQPLQLLLHGVGQDYAPTCVLEVGSVTPLAGIEGLRCFPGAGGRFDLRQEPFHPGVILLPRHPTGDVQKDKTVPHVGGWGPVSVNVVDPGPNRRAGKDT